MRSKFISLLRREGNDPSIWGLLSMVQESIVWSVLLVFLSLFVKDIGMITYAKNYHYER